MREPREDVNDAVLYEQQAPGRHELGVRSELGGHMRLCVIAVEHDHYRAVGAASGFVHRLHHPLLDRTTQEELHARMGQTVEALDVHSDDSSVAEEVKQV